MGFLHKLWDETLAGPAPDTGLGRLRKYNSFSAVRSPNHFLSRYHHHRHADDHDQTIPVTRTITILRPNNLSVVEPGSGPSSPATSSGPSSPFSTGTPRDEDVKRFTRKKQTLDAMEHAEATSPTVYDWIMISALDR